MDLTRAVRDERADCVGQGRLARRHGRRLVGDVRAVEHRRHGHRAHAAERESKLRGGHLGAAPEHRSERDERVAQVARMGEDGIALGEQIDRRAVEHVVRLRDRVHARELRRDELGVSLGAKRALLRGLQMGIDLDEASVDRERVPEVTDPADRRPALQREELGEAVAPRPLRRRDVRHREHRVPHHRDRAAVVEGRQVPRDPRRERPIRPLVPTAAGTIGRGHEAAGGGSGFALRGGRSRAPPLIECVSAKNAARRRHSVSVSVER